MRILLVLYFDNDAYRGAISTEISEKKQQIWYQIAQNSKRKKSEQNAEEYDQADKPYNMKIIALLL